MQLHPCKLKTNTLKNLEIYAFLSQIPRLSETLTQDNCKELLHFSFPYKKENRNQAQSNLNVDCAWRMWRLSLEQGTRPNHVIKFQLLRIQTLHVQLLQAYASLNFVQNHLNLCGISHRVPPLSYESPGNKNSECTCTYHDITFQTRQVPLLLKQPTAYCSECNRSQLIAQSSFASVIQESHPFLCSPCGGTDNNQANMERQWKR